MEVNDQVRSLIKQKAAEEKERRKIAKETKDGVLRGKDPSLDPNLVGGPEPVDPDEPRYPGVYGDEPATFWKDREVNLQKQMGWD